MMKTTLMHTIVRGVLGFAALLAVSLGSVQTANAQALEWAVEAPITAIDPVAGTITAGGVVTQIPADLVIEGTNGITGANLAALLDASAPSRVRSIFASAPGAAVGYSGGTLKSEGTIEQGPNGPVNVTTAIVVELAENVVAGPLDAVDPVAGTFVVNGVTCVMNPDERFPADILDAGFSPITLEDLATGIGTLATVIGYFHDGQMYAQTVESEVVPVNPGTDTVRITRAQGRERGNNNNELRVDGVVVPFDANATVTISDADTGAVLAVVPVALSDIPGQGSFGFRTRNLATMPTRVRAVSSNGGEHTVDVELR